MHRRGANRWSLGAALVVGALAAWSPALSAGKVAGPKVGRSFELTRLSGTVTFTVPGGKAAALTGTKQVPVGSTVQATYGLVRLTASNGKGGTYSGQFSRGAFQALQSRTGSSATEIKLVGNPCQIKPAGNGYHHHGHRSLPASGASYHHRGHRYLSASVPPDFLVVGANGSVQSSAGVAKFTLSDACSAGAATAASQSTGATTVVARSGQVRASSKNHRLQNPVSPGEIDQLRCSQSGGYCVVNEVKLKGTDRGFYFPAVATRGTAPTFQFCLTGPSRHRVCKPVATGPVFENGQHLPGGLNVVACQATRIGTYDVSWRVNGVQLGQPLSFHLSSVPKRNFRLPCQAYLGNFDANPQRIRLRANVKMVSRLSLPIGVHIPFMAVNIAPTGAQGREVVRDVIYADQGGVPGPLVAVTKSAAFTSTTPANSFDVLEFPGGKILHLPPGKYWIGVISGGNDNVVSIGSDVLGNSGAKNGNPYSAGPSSQFGPSTPENQYLRVNAVYFPGN